MNLMNQGIFWPNLWPWKICSAGNQALKRSQAWGSLLGIFHLMLQESMVPIYGHVFWMFHCHYFILFPYGEAQLSANACGINSLKYTPTKRLLRFRCPSHEVGCNSSISARFLMSSLGISDAMSQCLELATQQVFDNWASWKIEYSYCQITLY